MSNLYLNYFDLFQQHRSVFDLHSGKFGGREREQTAVTQKIPANVFIELWQKKAPLLHFQCVTFCEPDKKNCHPNWR